MRLAQDYGTDDAVIAYRTELTLMESILGILLLVGLFVLYYVVLPRLGVPT